MSEIVQKTVHEVAGRRFDTLEEAQAYVRNTKACAVLESRLEESSIYCRDTSANEIADWIVSNYETIKNVMEGKRSIKNCDGESA